MPKFAMLVALFAVPFGPVLAAPNIDYPVAVLQALDKVTARVTVLKAAVGQPTRFGSLEITARACREASPIEPPESAVFLEVREINRDGEESPKELFTGWMFASSPALSALEHPVYDVWPIDCGTEVLFGLAGPDGSPENAAAAND